MSYRNQSINLQSKSMDWFLYNSGLRQEKVNEKILNFIKPFPSASLWQVLHWHKLLLLDNQEIIHRVEGKSNDWFLYEIQHWTEMSQAVCYLSTNISKAFAETVLVPKKCFMNPLSANSTKWSSTLKQFVGKNMFKETLFFVKPIFMTTFVKF